MEAVEYVTNMIATLSYRYRKVNTVHGKIWITKIPAKGLI